MTLPFTRKNLRATKWRSSKLAQSSWFPRLWSRPAHWEGICQDSRKGNFFIPEKIPKLNDHDIFSQIGKEKTIWFNCRQEPVAYVNGVSVTPRYYCNFLQLDENKCWLTVIFEHIWSYLTRSKKNPHANIESSDCLEVSLGLWQWVTMRALVMEIKRWDLELIWATIWSQQLPNLSISSSCSSKTTALEMKASLTYDYEHKHLNFGQRLFDNDTELIFFLFVQTLNILHSTVRKFATKITLYKSVSTITLECDICENLDTNEYSIVFVSKNLHEWISEYIRITN